MNVQNFTQKSLEAVQTAQSMAMENRNNYISPEHLFYALADQDGGLIPSLLTRLGVDVNTLLSELDAAIGALPRVGEVTQVYLSADCAKVFDAAEKAAKTIGIDSVYSELMPGDKVKKVEEMLAGISRRGKLVYVGDGINDAPVLSRADVGIAMGAMGSDAAIEAADVVIMDDRLNKLPEAVNIARQTRKIVTQNIAMTLGVKGVILVLGALGFAGMWAAVFADVGIMVIAVLNAMRMLAE